MSRPWREVKSRRGAHHPGEHRGLCLSQPAVPVLRDHRRFHPCVFREIANMAALNRSRRFAVRPAAPPSRARRNSTLYRLKTPSQQIAMVRITHWPKGWTLPRPRGSSAFGKPPSRAFLSRAGKHAQTFHEGSFCHLRLPHLQLDELRTRLRSSKHLLWLWLAIDPRTKLIPVLSLGPRTWSSTPFVRFWIPTVFRFSQVMD